MIAASASTSRYWLVDDTEEDRVRDHAPLVRSVRSLLQRAVALLEIGVRRSFKLQCDHQQFKFQCEDNDEQLDLYAQSANLLRAADPEGEVTAIALQHLDSLSRNLRKQQSIATNLLARMVHKEARAASAESARVSTQLQSVARLPEADLSGVALASLLVARRAVQSVDDLMVSHKLQWRDTPQQKAINKWQQQAADASSELVQQLQPGQVQRQTLLYHALLCGDVELVGKLRAVEPTADLNQTMEPSTPLSSTPIRSGRYHTPHRAAESLSATAAAAPSLASLMRPSALSVLALDDTRVWDATSVLTLLSAGLDPTLPHPQLPHSSAIAVARAHLVDSGFSAEHAPHGEQKESEEVHRSRMVPPPAHAIQTSTQARLVQLHQQHAFLVQLCDRWTTHSSAVLRALVEANMHPRATVEVRAKVGAIIANYLDLQPSRDRGCVLSDSAWLSQHVSHSKLRDLTHFNSLLDAGAFKSAQPHTQALAVVAVAGAVPGAGFFIRRSIQRAAQVRSLFPEVTRSTQYRVSPDAAGDGYAELHAQAASRLARASVPSGAPWFVYVGAATNPVTGMPWCAGDVDCACSRSNPLAHAIVQEIKSS